jgi:ABC-type Mn2+/Zn2+ transport system permease subunit
MDIAQIIQSLLLDPVSEPLMQRVMLAVLLIGGMSGVVGAFVVTRGMAFLGDALAHTVLPGVAFSYIATNGNTQAVLLGGVAAGVVSAVIISFLSRGTKVSEDTAIGIVFAGALALGIAIISSSSAYTTDLSHLLVGNLLAVGVDDLLLMAGISLVVLAFVVVFYKEFLLISFDIALGEALRLPIRTLNTLLVILLALTVVIALQAVGIALVAGMIVIPAATARYFVKRMHHLMLLGGMVGALGGVAGVYVAWHMEIAPSAAIVLTLVMMFAAAFLFAPGKGYLMLRRRKQASTEPLEA